MSRENVVIKLKEANAPLTLAGLSFHVKDSYSDLVQQFPDILTPRFNTTVNKHDIEHHIITNGPPTHAQARRLDTEKLAAVKQEFLQMEQMGIICHSKSAWASPLHVVPKSNGQ